MKRIFSLLLTVVVCTAFRGADDKVHVDENGVIRWSDTHTEVSLFGANYCLPSACDYRAPSYIGEGGNRKAMIREDLDHFKRMTFDGLRVCFWGDRQNSDADGNLVVNDHLDLMCYLISEATERDIYMLLCPITTYDSQWPENDDRSNTGFILTHPKGSLTLSEPAIQAQCNYWKQLLLYRNPYTGRQLKDEPNILLLELINEPTQHPEDIPGMVRYINRLIGTIRETGCTKPTFYNLSQDFKVARAIADSEVEGSTYAWYPTGLDRGRGIPGNGLLYVDRYEQMDNPLINGKAKIVYEFDTPDVDSGYMYPAMVREFRRGGVQFAAIFSYDMLRTASRNLAWRTEYFNMVFTPSKAVSAMISAEVMRRSPRLKGYGYYPENNSFGDFRVSYEENLSVLNSGDLFYYSNDCPDRPRDPAAIRHIAGFGSSEVVRYEGSGIYFLDRNERKTWTIEVYPDVVELKDPFTWYADRTEMVRKPEYNLRHMSISLPSLRAELDLLPGRYTVNAKGRITAFEPLPNEVLYKQQALEAGMPDRKTYFVDGDNATPLVRARQDGSSRLFHTRTFANPRSMMRVGETFVYRVPDLSPQEHYLYPCDCSMGFYVGDRMAQRFPGHEQPSAIRIRAKGLDGTKKVLLNIVDRDGRGFGASVDLTDEWVSVDVPVSSLRPYPAAMLPLDWPGVNSYYYPLSLGSYDASFLDWNRVDWVQVSMRDGMYEKDDLKNKGVELESIQLIY